MFWARRIRDGGDISYQAWNLAPMLSPLAPISECSSKGPTRSLPDHEKSIPRRSPLGPRIPATWMDISFFATAYASSDRPSFRCPCKHAWSCKRSPSMLRFDAAPSRPPRKAWEIRAARRGPASSKKPDKRRALAGLRDCLCVISWSLLGLIALGAGRFARRAPCLPPPLRRSLVLHLEES